MPVSNLESKITIRGDSIFERSHGIVHGAGLQTDLICTMELQHFDERYVVVNAPDPLASRQTTGHELAEKPAVPNLVALWGSELWSRSDRIGKQFHGAWQCQNAALVAPTTPVLLELRLPHNDDLEYVTKTALIGTLIVPVEESTSMFVVAANVNDVPQSLVSSPGSFESVEKDLARHSII